MLVLTPEQMNSILNEIRVSQRTAGVSKDELFSKKVLSDKMGFSEAYVGKVLNSKMKVSHEFSSAFKAAVRQIGCAELLPKEEPVWDLDFMGEITPLADASLESVENPPMETKRREVLKLLEDDELLNSVYQLLKKAHSTQLVPTS